MGDHQSNKLHLQKCLLGNRDLRCVSYQCNLSELLFFFVQNVFFIYYYLQRVVEEEAEVLDLEVALVFKEIGIKGHKEITRG